jgi:hypothetical protein
MLEGQLIICDICRVDERMHEPAAITLNSWPGDGWVSETHDDFPDVHVCPRHADSDRRREVADPWHWTCTGCHRTTGDATPPHTWYSANLCHDCHEAQAES